MGEISAKARGQEEEEGGKRGHAEFDSKRFGETAEEQRMECQLDLPALTFFPISSSQVFDHFVLDKSTFPKEGGKRGQAVCHSKRSVEVNVSLGEERR